MKMLRLEVVVAVRDGGYDADVVSGVEDVLDMASGLLESGDLWELQSVRVSRS